MLDHLPLEAWKEIFTRLPVKSILLMRLVCKNFNSLISDPAFRTAHFKKSKNNQKILIRHLKHKFLMLNDEDKKLVIMNSEEIRFPADVSSNPRYWIVGSIDGLVCFCKDYAAAEEIVLWNPSIRKCLYLPQKQNMHDSSFYYVLGFGFNPKTNDYKVVRLTCVKNNDGVPPTVELFTLSSQSWRILDNDGSWFVIHENIWPQTYLNGVVHWIGYEPNGITLQNLIISFDMSDESFGKIKFPDVLATSETASHDLSLSVLKDKLSLIHFETTSGQEKYLIWLMDEYGQEGSWRKQYTIDLHAKISKMICSRKNGELIMATKKGQLITYDTETGRMTNIRGIRGDVKSFLVVSYIDSLVLLDQKETI